MQSYISGDHLFDYTNDMQEWELWFYLFASIWQTKCYYARPLKYKYKAQDVLPCFQLGPGAELESIVLKQSKTHVERATQMQTVINDQGEYCSIALP